MVKQRIFGYDVIRVVGMCFVVCVHALAVLDSTWEMTWPLTVCGQSLFFTANAMFFMVSGRFNLREQRSGFELRSFYLKKARGIALPVVVLFLSAAEPDGMMTQFSHIEKRSISYCDQRSAFLSCISQAII